MKLHWIRLSMIVGFSQVVGEIGGPLLPGNLPKLPLSRPKSTKCKNLGWGLAPTFTQEVVSHEILILELVLKFTFLP